MSSPTPLFCFNAVLGDDSPITVEVVSVIEPKAPATTVVIEGRLKDAQTTSPRTTWTLHYNTATDQHQFDIVASGKLKNKITLPIRQVIGEGVVMRYKNGFFGGSQVRHLTPSPPFSF